MNLVKTSLLNGIAVVVKMLTLLGLNKLLAVYLGPTGFALLGQFQNAMQMIITFASGAINSGVTVGTAEHEDEEEQQHKVWSTACAISLSGALLASLVIAAASKPLALFFLKDEQYSSVFLWFSASLSLFVLNALLLAILNGKKEIGLYVAANIAGSIFSLVVTASLSVYFGLEGALIGLATFQSLSFIVTLMMCVRTKWFRVRHFLGGIDREVARTLGKFTLMAATSALCVPASHLLIRNHLGTSLGWEFAGYWEAVWRLSAAYLMLVTTTLSVYFLPKLASLTNSTDIRAEIVRGYKIILPLVLVAGYLVYLLRDLLLLYLFSEEFAPARVLFTWQLVGDFLKIASWVLGYLALAKAMVKVHVGTEIFFSSAFVILSVVFTNAFGLVGVAYAHALNYALYLGCMLLVTRHYFGTIPRH